MIGATLSPGQAGPFPDGSDRLPSACTRPTLGQPHPGRHGVARSVKWAAERLLI